MNKILLRNTLPQVFSHRSSVESDIWLKEVSFEKTYSYLIEANSGKGKSSLCSYIYGYRTDYCGDIFFDGLNIQTIKPKEWDNIHVSRISLLFQELNLFQELTAIENVKLKNNLTKCKSDNEIRGMFEKLNIDSKIDKRIGLMSWGEQQRVAIIRALCQPFDFLFLDEPVSHLDEYNAGLAAQLITEVATAQGAGIVSTSIGKSLPLDYAKTYRL